MSAKAKAAAAESVSPWYVLAGVAAIVPCALWGMDRHDLAKATVCLLFGAWAIFLILRGSLVLHRRRAIAAAMNAEDVAKARAAADRLAGMSANAAWRAYWTMVGGSLLALDERYAESRAILEAIDREVLTPIGKVALDNDLAWALAHDGAATEAVALAERAVAECPKGAPAEIASSCVGTLGVAQLKSGRSAEARETLERALALGGAPRNVATRAFYLGDALIALAQPHDAAAAYDRAARATPDGLYGKKAKAALAALTSTKPYRG